ncbi:hypothetical protein H7100_00640 [Candidatus Saccharibacteria bacterium]|nr:hypothetical protein [Candidatus Saccharibacteria bacterium]
MSMLEDMDALDTDFWSAHEIFREGKLPAERLWHDVDALRNISFQDGAVSVVNLQRQLAELLENAVTYYQQNIDAEVDEANRFLLSRPNLFITDQASGRALQCLVTAQDEKGRASIAVHYSDNTEAFLGRQEVFIDTALLTESEQQAVAVYRREYLA